MFLQLKLLVTFFTKKAQNFLGFLHAGVGGFVRLNVFCMLVLAYYVLPYGVFLFLSAF